MNPSPISPDSVEAHWCALVNESSQHPDGDHDLPEELRLLGRLNAVRKLLQADSTAANANKTPTDAQDATPLAIGTNVDGYEITRLLGRGGMAVVYQARQLALDRNVALKLIRTGPLATTDDLARFEAEAAATASLQHPGIVAVHDTGIWQGLHYFSMQLIDGPTLSHKLSTGPLDSREAAQLTVTIAQAVDYAHHAGILHRDLKPSNVIIESETGQPFVADFGLAKLLSTDDSRSELTLSGAMVGTPSYMSPEQAFGDSKRVSPASDVYALGAILYEMITGRAPFRAASPIETARQVIEEQPVAPKLLNSTVPTDLQTICLKALAKEPDRRYPTAKALANDLQRFLDNRPIVARPTSVIESMRLWSRRNRALAGALVLLFITLAAGTVVSSLMWMHSERNAQRAEQSAGDLRDSRQRLRNSISRFQGRILSDQALHLQMNSELRREMFGDVIEYLDEFASLRTSGSEFDAELTNDYLVVAEAALQIGEVKQAQDAARRALSLLRPFSETPGMDFALLHHRAAKAALMSLEPSTLDSDHPNLAHALLEETKRASEQAVAADPSHRAAILAMFQSRYLDISNSDDDESRSTNLEALLLDMSAFREPNNKSPLDIEAARLACQVGWDLVPMLEASAGLNVLKEIEDTWLYHLRETFHELQRPVVEYHNLKAVNTTRMAALQESLGDRDTAIKTFFTATHDFRRAIEGSPQNRLWIKQAAECDLHIAELNLAKKEFYGAGAYFEEAIKKHVRLIQSDAKDYEARRSIIAIMARHGELETVQKFYFQAARVYYIASNDCRLLFASEHREWAFQTRLWLLSQVVARLNELATIEPNEDSTESQITEFRQQFDAIEKSFLEAAPTTFPEYDTSRIADILNGDFVPPRPPLETGVPPRP